MQNQPILVFAQSARFIAQSATLAGYTVWVADCYGDVDTRQYCTRYQQLPSLQQLSAQQLLNILQQLSQHQPCYLLCGTGIEQFYSILSQLPAHITFLGTSAKAVRQVKQFPDFFTLLSQLNLNYPPTQATQPEASENWLIKSGNGFGGTHINYAMENANTPLPLQTEHYFQQYINGISGSACFISNGDDCMLLSINEQFHAIDNFRLDSIISPLTLSASHNAALQDAIAKLSAALNVKGLASLDFIIHDNALFILELNPRISSSAELINNPMLFHWHIAACNGQPLDIYLSQSNEVRQLKYIFTETALTIPDHIEWPVECHDIPAPGTYISAQQPVCTLVLSAADKQTVLHKSEQIESNLQQKLTFLS